MIGRSEPAELRLSVEALYGLSWPRAAHLAVVDSVERGWDTSASWIAGIATISKSAALDAGEANLRAGVYSRRWYSSKVSRDGTAIRGTHFVVSDSWTTRNGVRDRDCLFVRLDRRFLAAHPRASALTKRVYHLLAFEQWRYGACSLSPAHIAAELGVAGTTSQAPADAVNRALRSLEARGECDSTEGLYTLPRYPFAEPEPSRLDPARRRSAGAAKRRDTLPETSAERPLGTSSLATRNQLPSRSEPPNDIERRITTTSSDPERVERRRTPDAETKNEKRSEQKQLRRHDWGADWANLYYYAEQATHERIERFVQALTKAYDRSEALAALRDACLSSEATGHKVLAALRRKFPNRDPESANARAVSVPDVFRPIPA